MSAHIKLTEGYIRGQPKGRPVTGGVTQVTNGQIKSASGYSPRLKAEIAPPPPLQPQKHNGKK
ncbi:MAG: hypothetical protein DU429_07730 [Candidatus Tokpelaia sp.]|uniref:hypothetical protein n=1 Tax=Candidatus Tokpelaia sp. TaxID=2233777 RepID=UPI00123AB077|nr:hypothetical protein [Candidatus Tokpelaia sp.]KAA6205624.1 MAG: hypothetical protein DU429_07730 [Candidatus Tokpelaia sp.]KAA6206298.1 MAG: hypothetical protein DU430_01915 [Candidatus Tokpelaia sp.]KAA6406267.1 hypothetical protein DPQ22_00135 [Candidatus Tokpelaia sp.]